MLGSGGLSSSVTYVGGGDGRAAGYDFPFTATGTAVGDWTFIVADGVNATSVTGGSGTSWTKITLVNAGGLTTTVFYRQLVSGDAGATFTVNGLFNSNPVEWVSYRGAVSANVRQSVTTALNASNIVFASQSLSLNSSRLLAIISSHGTGHTGSWSAPANWTARVSVDAIGPKYLGDITSALYASGGAGSITFTTTQSQPEGQVGWLFELIGS